MPLDTLSNRAAAAVLKDMYGKEPIPFRVGGTIPVMPYIQRILGIDVTMFAFSSGDENVHAPDEFLRLSCFERTQAGYILLFNELANQHSGRKEQSTTDDDAAERAIKEEL